MKIMQVCRYASMQVCKYAGMQVCRYASMQVCRYAIMQIYYYACIFHAFSMHRSNAHIAAVHNFVSSSHN